MLIYRAKICDDTPLSRHETAHTMLSDMLCEYTTHTYDEIATTNRGKPYIDSVAFSMSHCKNIAVVAMDVDKAQRGDVVVSEKHCGCVGVDVELLDPDSVEKLRKVAKRKFFENENKALSESSDDIDYAYRFCRMWTKKESYSKYTGYGLMHALSFDSTIQRSDVGFFYDIIKIDDKSYIVCVCYNSIRE